MKFRGPHLPLPEKPRRADTTVLRNHVGNVKHIVVIPESNRIATATDKTPGLSIFALHGDGEPLHVCGPEVEPAPVIWRGLAAIGGDLLAFGDLEGYISTWCASSGTLLDHLALGTRDKAYAVAMLGHDKFVIGTDKGELLFMSHRDGRDLREVARGGSSHDEFISYIAVLGDMIVTTSRDKTAAVWSVATRKRIAVLRGHKDWVMCADICPRLIAIGSKDETIRLYEAGGTYALLRVIEGLHSDTVFQVAFLGDDMLMSASADKTVTFTSLSTINAVVRLDIGFCTRSVIITPDARLACVGADSGGALLSPPDLVLDTIKSHAASVFGPVIPSVCWGTHEDSTGVDVGSHSGRRKRQRVRFEGECDEHSAAGKRHSSEIAVPSSAVHEQSNESAVAAANNVQTPDAAPACSSDRDSELARPG